MGGTGAKKNAFNLYGKESALGDQYNSQALGLNNVLAPALTAETLNPQGYNPTEIGTMRTSAEQAAGGSNASAAGEATLRAARTRNYGSGQAATADATRAASERLSQTNANIDTNNAMLKEKQRQEGLSGLSDLYGTDVRAGENALGLANNANQVAGNQKPGFWQGFGQNFANDALKAAFLPLGG